MLWFLRSCRYRVCNEQGSPVKVVGVVQDITERKGQEDLIKENLDELQRWQAVMLGRESRNIELKAEVNLLLKQLGEPARYISTAEDQHE